MTERIGAAKPPNPAKEALRGYRSILRQREEARRELEEHYARATSCTVRLKTYKAAGGAASYDRMADDALSAADAREVLADWERELGRQAADLRRLMDVPTDQLHREVVLRRYLRGQRWEEIAEAMHCDKVTAWRWHGEALKAINAKLAGEKPPKP